MKLLLTCLKHARRVAAFRFPFTLAVAIAVAPIAQAAPPPRMHGVNLSAAAFHGSGIPGNHGTDYYYPEALHLDYYKARGIELIRFPFRWERVQRTLNGALDATEMARMDSFITLVEARGMRVILDMHNYGRCFIGGTEYLIGSSQVPRSAYQDAWRRLADRYKTRDCIWGYAIMNEPHDTAPYVWKDTAQFAISGIRQVDTVHPIIVPGDGWSGAWSWNYFNSTLNTLTDPANNLVFEAHQYFDNRNSGDYDQSYDAEGAYPNIGPDRLAPFVNWCASKGVRGIIGELGVPDNDPRWTTVLANALNYAHSNNISTAYWCGGPGWGTYALRSEMRPGHDEAPQMTPLIAVGGGPRTRHWPLFSWYRDAVNPGAQGCYSYEYKSTNATLSTSFADHPNAYQGYYGIRLSYTVPSGGYAGAGMHIHGGVNLAGNVSSGQVLTFYAKGTAGAFLNVFFSNPSSQVSNKVSTAGYVTLNPSTWQKVTIPLSAFVNANLNGTQRATRLVMECLPWNGTSHNVYVDEFIIQHREYNGPNCTVTTADGASSYKVGAGITANSTASDSSGIDKVEFLLDGQRFAVDSTAPYAAVFSMSTVGTHRLTAIAYDGQGNPGRSTVRTLTAQP